MRACIMEVCNQRSGALRRDGIPRSLWYVLMPSRVIDSAPPLCRVMQADRKYGVLHLQLPKPLRTCGPWDMNSVDDSFRPRRDSRHRLEVEYRCFARKLDYRATMLVEWSLRPLEFHGISFFVGEIGRVGMVMNGHMNVDKLVGKSGIVAAVQFSGVSSGIEVTKVRITGKWAPRFSKNMRHFIILLERPSEGENAIKCIDNIACQVLLQSFYRWLFRLFSRFPFFHGKKEKRGRGKIVHVAFARTFTPSKTCFSVVCLNGYRARNRRTKSFNDFRSRRRVCGREGGGGGDSARKAPSRPTYVMH